MSEKMNKKIKGFCYQCKWFEFDPENKPHYYLDETSGYGECTHPEASKEYKIVGFHSTCKYFERKEREKEKKHKYLIRLENGRTITLETESPIEKYFKVDKELRLRLTRREKK